jgi:hypothetical protein
MGPPGDEKRLLSATTLPGNAPLPFVISTEAQRSGEISVWMLFLGSVFLAEPTRISYFALLATAAYAALRKESRTQISRPRVSTGIRRITSLRGIH